MRKLKFLILIFILITSSSAFAKIYIKTTFIHLGLIHNSHFDPNYNYPASALLSVVENVKPDLICGEAVEAKWSENLAGLFPFENRILEYGGKKVGAAFVAVDWRTTYQEASSVFNEIKKYSSEEFLLNATTERNKLDEEFEKIFSSHIGNGFFRYLHTSFWKDAGFYHTRSERFFGDAPNGFWYRRNANIAYNCYQAAMKANSKRVLIAYGAEHQYILDALLKNIPEAKSVSLGEAVQLSKIKLSSEKLPIDLKTIFNSDLQRLREYVNLLPKESSEKTELEKKRIPGLEKIIQSMFP